ncbi:hypothetical protein IQ07DRAFT_21821 [Pyrenochaeta sp. DS3sAY3a]|nr:hypothetical protein IQ07DRAFT_21821 [Pyrenochaeta sp. DS3sAY3a]
MSLFGGSLPRSTQPARSPTSTASPPPSVEEPTDLQNAQIHDNADALDESDETDDLSTDSDSEIEESDAAAQTRPNRFGGKPQTWKAYTAPDRQIAASLEQMQDSDLAAHLFNAHFLKRQAQQPAEQIAGLPNWHSRESWLKKGTELEYTDVSGLVQTQLIPSKDWTAWPIPPAQLPGSDMLTRTDGPDGDTDEWEIGGVSAHDAGDDMREEILATFLRLAKDRWESRETEEPTVRGRDHVTVSRSRSRSTSALSTKPRRSASQTDVDMEGDDLRASDEDEDKLGGTVGKKRGRKIQAETVAKPTVMTDDSKAQRVLQPTIQSLLSNLDDLALAVSRTRLNHFARTASSERSSLSEFTSDTDSVRPSSQPLSRPTSRNARSRNTSARPTSRHKATAARSTSSRRQKQGTEFDDDESDAYESRSKSQARKRQRSGSITSMGSVSTTRDESSRAGLMDWSEVLGLAAVKGWDEKVIARTAQRCAALFGESMSFVPLDENQTTKNVLEPVHYTPSSIPAPSVLSATTTSASKRPFFQLGTLRCPHPECYGHRKDFALPYRVVEHCMRVHGYDPRTNNSENEDRLHGGVHIDGFMQPVTLKPGWLGHGRAKAGKTTKKQKRGDEEGPADAIMTTEGEALSDA